MSRFGVECKEHAEVTFTKWVSSHISLDWLKQIGAVLEGFEVDARQAFRKGCPCPAVREYQQPGLSQIPFKSERF
jgi:hypothetical protein